MAEGVEKAQSAKGKLDALNARPEGDDQRKVKKAGRTKKPAAPSTGQFAGLNQLHEAAHSSPSSSAQSSPTNSTFGSSSASSASFPAPAQASPSRRTVPKPKLKPPVNPAQTQMPITPRTVQPSSLLASSSAQHVHTLPAGSPSSSPSTSAPSFRPRSALDTASLLNYPHLSLTGPPPVYAMRPGMPMMHTQTITMMHAHSTPAPNSLPPSPSATISYTQPSMSYPMFAPPRPNPSQQASAPAPSAPSQMAFAPAPMSYSPAQFMAMPYPYTIMPSFAGAVLLVCV